MSPAEKHTILNVDDYEVKRYARTHILRQAGFEVDEASNGTEALHLVNAHPPEIVLLDINLPDIDGYEVCRRIKSNPATSSILVLHISSTMVNREDRTRGLDNGADGYVVEPIDPQELLANVNALLRMRKAENALRAASREWRTTFDSIEDGVCLLDPGSTIRRVNVAFSRVMKKPMDELIGRKCRDLFGSACAGLDRTIETGQSANSELSIDERTYQIRFSPVLVEEKLHGVVSTFRDVTDILKIEREREDLIGREQEARAAAESANQVKDEFLAAVSHELRGPLQAILIWTRLLREDSLDEAARLRTIESLDRSAHTQARLIDDLLDLSRIISGKLKLDLSPCDLRPVALVTLETVHPSAEAKQIRLDVQLGSIGAPILGDPDRLQQVLWNVLSNAVKFTPKQGHVEVRLNRLEDSVTLTVSDDGVGIAPELLPHVFEHFRQGEGAPGGRSGGLGLGLSIARRLVELHGGTIDVASAGQGQGSTVTITLPLNLDSHRPAPGVSFPFQS